MSEFIPKYIKQTVNAKEREVVTSARWNELFTLNIEANDNNTKALYDLVNTGDLKPFNYTEQEGRLQDVEALAAENKDKVDTLRTEYDTFHTEQTTYNTDNTTALNNLTTEVHTEVPAIKADLNSLSANVIRKDDEEPFMPTADPQPASKRYVDNTVNAAVMGSIPDHSITVAKLAPDAQTAFAFNPLYLIDTTEREITIFDQAAYWGDNISIPTTGWLQVTDGDYTEYVHPDGYHLKTSTARPEHPAVNLVNGLGDYWMTTITEMNAGSVELTINKDAIADSFLLLSNSWDATGAGNNEPTGVDVNVVKTDNDVKITWTVLGTSFAEASARINSITAVVKNHYEATYKTHTLKKLYYSTDRYSTPELIDGQKILFIGPETINLDDVEAIYINNTLIQDDLALEEDLFYEGYKDPATGKLLFNVYDDNESDIDECPHIQYGTISSTKGAWQYCKFKYPFANIPTVVANITGENQYNAILKIGKVTNKGFEYKVDVYDSYSGYISSGSSWSGVAKTVLMQVTKATGDLYDINYVALQG